MKYLFFCIVIFSAFCNISYAQAVRSRVPVSTQTFPLVGATLREGFEDFPDALVYKQTVAKNFGVVSPENQLKWIMLNPEKGVYDWKESDAFIDFAQRNRKKAIGHALVWYRGTPSWVTAVGINPDRLEPILQDYIQAVVGRYKEEIDVWDVVNEAIDDKKGYVLRKNLWSDNFGEQFIDIAFLAAQQADPTAVLLYNDYDIEEENEKSDAVFALLQRLKSRNVPVQAIGMQMHVDIKGIDYASFANNMQRFADAGFDIHITEMDVRIPLPITPEKEKQQQDVFINVFKACVAQPRCKRLSFWGVADTYSWVPDHYDDPPHDDPLPFDRQYAPKAAWEFMRKTVVKTTPIRWRSLTPTPLSATNP